MDKDLCIKLQLSLNREILETPSVIFTSSMTVPLLCASLRCVRMGQCVCPFSWWGWDRDLNSGAAGCHRLTLCFISVLCLNISGVLVAPWFLGLLFPCCCCLVLQRTFFQAFCRDQLAQGERLSMWTRPRQEPVCLGLPLLNHQHRKPLSGSRGLKTAFPLHLFTI